MNTRLAQLRSPVALLSCCALLCAALAAVLAFSSRAEAIEYQRVGAFTLEPATGSIAADVIATSAKTDAPCPAGTQTYANATSVKLLDPSDPAGRVTGQSKALANGPKSTLDLTTSAFTLPLISTAVPPVVKATSLEKALRSYKPEGSLDGTYTLVLQCSIPNADPAALDAVFVRKVRVTGDSWAQIDQQPVTLALTAEPDGGAVGTNAKLVAQVSPASAAGRVEFKHNGTSLGTAQVASGKAELPVTLPASGGQTTYDAAFTPADPDAYGAAQVSKTLTVRYLVSAKDDKGQVLGDKPTLTIGQTVKITIKGFAANAKVVLTDVNGTTKEIAAGADGTVLDHAYTVPNGTTDDTHILRFQEGGNAAKEATFTYVSTEDETTGSPTPTGPAELEVTDESGTSLGDNPDLAAGQKVLITARGFAKGGVVKVTLGGSDAKFGDAKAGSDGTVTKYAFTVPAGIADGDHTLTLAGSGADTHKVAFAFAFTTGAPTSESPSPTPSDSVTPTGDSGGSNSGGSDSGGGSGSGGAGGSGGTGGSMASTGTQAGAIGLTALALVSAGAAIVLHMRRRGLLSFGEENGGGQHL
ncbi:hypothetical protein ABZX85_50095 [Streptomyces sp. NPDC004539]|uniref:hypothetical protein n=1 Tax=Streptomyces sp. NPDC004539 TaxID=3154280 RepID=UPI0033A0ABA3